jgi:AcrR family transcriptional regulator
MHVANNTSSSVHVGDDARDARELDWLWRRRCSADGATAACPRCGPARFHRLRRRLAYACDRCGCQLRPTAGTLFAGSSTPLAVWFQACALVVDVVPPPTPKQLGAALGLGYKPAWRMRNAIRAAVAGGDADAALLRAVAAEWRGPYSAAEDAPRASGPLEIASEAKASGFDAESPRRDMILAAACRVLAARGLERTRVADIAAEAGVSSGVIHYYFAGKEQLLVTALEWTDERFFCEYERLSPVTDPPLERLRVLLTLMAPSTDLSRGEWLLWVDVSALARGRPALMPALERMARRFRALIRSVIESGVQSGAFRPVARVDEVCQRLSLYSEGLAARLVLGYEGVTPPDVAALLFAFAEEQLGLATGTL